VKKILLPTLALSFAAFAMAPASAQTSVGVSIGINQPGVYGRIDIGNYPQPRFVNVQPVVIIPQPRYVVQEPIYLYVPEGHQKHWEKHCYRYNACGRPVYFVQEDWVRERYDDHRRYEGRDGGDRRDHERRDDGRRGDDRGDNRGNGHGKGRDKGERD